MFASARIAHRRTWLSSSWRSCGYLWRLLTLTRPLHSPSALRRISCDRIFESVLRQRLVTVVLLLTVFSVDRVAASVCESYCARSHGHHHHQGEAWFSSHRHIHAHQRSTNCPECTKSPERLPLHPPGCGIFTQVQVLQVSSRVSWAASTSSQLNLTTFSTSSSSRQIESERFSALHSPAPISSLDHVRVSLRI